MWTDALGNPVTLRREDSLAPLNDFVEGFIASEARAVNILQAQEDASPLVQACCAALHMFAESAQAPRHARPFIERAQAGAGDASVREQRFIAAVAAWVDGDIARAIALHEEQAREFPRDLVSLKLAQYHLFNRGDAPGMLRVALPALPAAADVPYLHGMLAFAWEQCHFLEEAEACARRANALRRKAVLAAQGDRIAERISPHGGGLPRAAAATAAAAPGSSRRPAPPAARRGRRSACRRSAGRSAGRPRCSRS